MKKIEIVGEVVETLGVGLGGRYSEGDVSYLNSKDKCESLADLLYKKFLDKKVRVTVEEIE